MAELKEDIDDYIEFYNHKRFHETLQYKKPMKTYYESMLNQEKKKIAA
ncbi:MAG: IS3 family transposase [Mariprofundaceae bacterium]